MMKSLSSAGSVAARAVGTSKLNRTNQGKEDVLSELIEAKVHADRRVLRA